MSRPPPPQGISRPNRIVCFYKINRNTNDTTLRNKLSINLNYNYNSFYFVPFGFYQLFYFRKIWMSFSEN